MTGGGLRRMVLSIQDRLHKAFIPNKKDVTDDYWEWLKWRLVQVRVGGVGGYTFSLWSCPG